MRLALVQFNPTVGAIEANAAGMVKRIDEARAAGADIVMFPELALCGYPPKDLLLHEGFVDENAAVAKRIGEGHTKGITVVFGAALPAGEPGTGRIANSLLVYRDGKFVDYYDKRLLPTYDVFDENRYFTPGNRAVVFDCGGMRCGLSICEDLWKGEDAGFASRYDDAADPVVELAAAGARVILSPSASPFVLGKAQRHREILKKHAKRHGAFVVSLNQLGGNDDLVFDGHAMVLDPSGRLIAAGRGFEEGLVVVDIDGPRSGGVLKEVADPLDGADEELLFKALVLGTRDYCRKTGFKTAVLGISGGIDSAVVAAIGAIALGPGNVTGLVLPSKYSSEHSKADAYDLAKRLGIRSATVPIEEPVTGFRRVIDPLFTGMEFPALGAKLPDLCEENLQSRVRGTTLMAFSNRTGAIVLTTGNKSEMAVGYATLYGDMNGGLAVLIDVGKQQVYRLARWMNENWKKCGFTQAPIPESSITKAPSAELRPDQTDQDSLPPYDQLDQVIERYVEGKQAPSTIVRETGLDEAMVRRVARMIDVAEYKRKQAAVGLKVTTVAFGSGRRVPIAQGWRAR
jgi:NAD+ synthase (glutamine-hydrolysing)